MHEQVDLRELERRLSRIFPSLVTLSDSSQSITVMGRVKVTSVGVEGESGPVADRVKAIFDEYLRDQSQVKASVAPPQKKVAVRNPFRCQHCGLRLTSGRVYRRTIGGSNMLFCCKQCADHEETEFVRIGRK